MSDKPYGDYKGFHHWYLGAIIAFTGWFLGWFVHNTYGVILGCLGVLIMLDDWSQHFLKLGDKTPCRIIHNWLKKYRWYQNLTTWADKLFGKKI